MILKSAYFSVVGLDESAEITWKGHLRTAIQSGRAMGIAWPPSGEGHNIRVWAELLIAERASSPATAYAAPFDIEVQKRGQRLERLWRETLRYRKNYAYLHEVRQVREAAEWLLVHSHSL